MSTPYKGNARKIKDGLVTILQGITYDTGSGAEPAFVSVLDNTKDEFEGFPSVRVLPNNQTTQREDSASFDHVMRFAVIMHLPLSTPTDVETATYNQMLDLTDLIQDTLEHNDAIDELVKLDPTLPTFMMNVDNVTWHVANGKTGAMLLVNLNVGVTYSKYS